jgi:prevent-host-death family protein
LRNRDGSDAVAVEATEARRLLGGLINRVEYGRERVLILRRGRLIGALVPVADLGSLSDEAA